MTSERARREQRFWDVYFVGCSLSTIVITLVATRNLHGHHGLMSGLIITGISIVGTALAGLIVRYFTGPWFERQDAPKTDVINLNRETLTSLQQARDCLHQITAHEYLGLGLHGIIPALSVKEMRAAQERLGAVALKLQEQAARYQELDPRLAVDLRRAGSASRRFALVERDAAESVGSNVIAPNMGQATGMDESLQVEALIARMRDYPPKYRRSKRRKAKHD